MEIHVLASIRTMFQKVTPPQKKTAVFFFFVNPVKFQKSNYSSQLFDISLFKDIKHEY